MSFPDKCPAPVVFFLAGILPFQAHLHIRQLGLIRMIYRLNRLARSFLTSDPDNSKSRFIQIRHLCHQYNLPSPSSTSPTPIQIHLQDYGQVRCDKLLGEVTAKRSLFTSFTFLLPSSVHVPHPTPPPLLILRAKPI